MKRHLKTIPQDLEWDLPETDWDLQGVEWEIPETEWDPLPSPWDLPESDWILLAPSWEIPDNTWGESLETLSQNWDPLPAWGE